MKSFASPRGGLTRGYMGPAGFAAAALLLWSVAALFFFQTQRLYQPPAFDGPFGGLPDRILGSAKEGVGDILFLKADQYFHGGVAGPFEEHDGALEKEGLIGDGHDHEHGHESPAGPGHEDWIAAIHEQIVFRGHYHLAGGDRKEMLPFLALATSLDPYHAEAVLTSAYWLCDRFQKTDEAIGVLEKGIAAIPEDWELEYSLAKILLKKKGDAASAASHFERALVKSRGKGLRAFESGDLYFFLAESYRSMGERARAKDAYQKTLAVYGDKVPAGLKRMILGQLEGLGEAAR